MLKLVPTPVPRFLALHSLLDHVAPADIGRAVEIALAKRVAAQGVFFIGNGGSAGIAQHMAADWFKAGKFRSMCFNDASMLTMLGNDLGYEHVFDEPIKKHAETGDLLFAISSSGRSLNILNAVSAANKLNMDVITLSGFREDNPLREMGIINFFVPSQRYGLVEVAHHAILHAILDEITG